MTKAPVKIGLVDDHILVREGFTALLKPFEEFTVSLVACNGKELIEKLNPGNIPDIILLDLAMPVMDGHETARWLFKNHPEIKVLILTIFDAESLIHMIADGVRGFIKKDMHPSELRKALHSVVETGSYCCSAVTKSIFGKQNNPKTKTLMWGTIMLNENEITFLKLSASEMTYKEIAKKMQISPRTIDNYRDSLFIRLGVKSRVGLVTYAIKAGIVILQY